MTKRFLIYSSILFSVIYIIYLVLSYNGVFRKNILSMVSINSLIHNYSKLPVYSDTQRIVLCFSTTPDRISDIQPMIKSILDQTVKVNMIALVIPYKYQNKEYNIPPYLSNIVNVIRAGKDYGQGTKLIPMLLREKDCNTIIIALNDNVIYGKEFVETMLEECDKNPDTVLTDNSRSSILLKPGYFGCDVIDRDKDKFDTNWFIDKSSKSHVVDYTQNFLY